MLTKITVETALNVKLDSHLGYGRHQASSTSNSAQNMTTREITATFNVVLTLPPCVI